MKYRFPILLFSVVAASLLWSCQGEPRTGNGQRASAHHTADSNHHSAKTSTTALAAAPQVKEKEMYENTNRMVWQKPDLVLGLMGDLSHKTVADIGAGTGFFSKRLAKHAEKVIAIDIDKRFLNYIDSVKVFEMSEEAQARLETRLAEPDDPNLEPGEADVIIIVNTFMYIRDKEAYLETLRQSLSDGGELFIIDFKKKRTELGPPSDIRLPLFEVEEMLYQAGYQDIDANDTALDYQYIITARKGDSTAQQ